MTDRITGLVLLLLAIAYGLHARTFRTNFMTDPLGPRAWPIMLAAILALLSLYLMFRPERRTLWLKRIVLLRQLVLVAGLVVYAVFLEQIGFLTATVLLMAFMAALLGARWWQAVLAGIVSSPLLFLLFNNLLGLPLPMGSLFKG